MEVLTLHRPQRTPWEAYRRGGLSLLWNLESESLVCHYSHWWDNCMTEKL